uniref:Peptidoglycan binding domain-containing protein n=1 Tax=Candidatus Kentrum sp. DK TaxID=2126562 RepID=A0A450T6V0_9GAMM|nr:MAG: Putative peptidoglycan binding domain-containing protein [Candidatus Kentron sp. DK]
MTTQSRKDIRKLSVAAMALCGMALASGCATTNTYEDTDASTAQENRVAPSEAPRKTEASGEFLPPNAKPGECYARVWVEPTYATQNQRVLVKEASEKIDIIPAEYDWVEETVEVSAASTRLVPVPAVYGTETESIQVRPATREWLVDNKPNAAPASNEVLERARTHGIDLDAARSGMCFHEHYLPAGYRETATEVEVSPASEEISIIPAKYRDVEKRVLIKEASRKVTEVPAVYETVTEKVIDEPAHTVWKKGTGPIQKIDEATGEIMCLVEVPATYKTITKRVIKTPATTRVIEIPAKYNTIEVRELVSDAREERSPIPARYKTVKGEEKISEGKLVWHEVRNMAHPTSTRTGAKICLLEKPAKFKSITRRVIKTPASTRTIEVPAQYKTVKVRKMVSQPQEKRMEIPAEYKEVTVRELKQDGHMEWRSILCKTNMTVTRVRNIQRALKEAGYNPGPIDGIAGPRTMKAVNAFQKAKGLPVDRYLNAETVKALGVSLR